MPFYFIQRWSRKNKTFYWVRLFLINVINVWRRHLPLSVSEILWCLLFQHYIPSSQIQYIIYYNISLYLFCHSGEIWELRHSISRLVCASLAHKKKKIYIFFFSLTIYENPETFFFIYLSYYQIYSSYTRCWRWFLLNASLITVIIFHFYPKFLKISTIIQKSNQFCKSRKQLEVSYVFHVSFLFMLWRVLRTPLYMITLIISVLLSIRLS